MNKRQRKKHGIKRHIRLIEYNYFCGMCEYRKIRPKAIWDFNKLKRKRLNKKAHYQWKCGVIRYVPTWMKRGYKIMRVQYWNGKWWEYKYKG